MSQNSGYRKGKMRSKGGAAQKTHDENNAVQNAFAKYSQELDDKHDRHERLVKLSRDITIEAKRIIFLLHTIDERKNNRVKILNEAEERLQKVIATNFKAVAKELAGLDVYQYRYAYSPGLQEFIEAYTFMEYLKNEVEDEKEGAQLSDWQALQKKMHFEDVEKSQASDKDNQSDAKSSELQETETKTEYSFMVCPHEYILGLSDLTGELMRRCINALGSGETATCLETCKALQQFYTGYIGLNVQRSRELSRKIFTMRQSVLKTENVCYNVKVRGGEAAKWGAVYDVKHSDDIDEGFF